MRTYSRRALKRRATLSPKRADNTMVDHPQSISSSVPQSLAGKKRVLDREPSGPSRKRTRLSVPARLESTPTDLFFEHMSSSVPLLVAFQQSQQNDASSYINNTQASDDWHSPVPEGIHPVSEESGPVMTGINGNATSTRNCKSVALKDVIVDDPRPDILEESEGKSYDPGSD